MSRSTLSNLKVRNPINLFHAYAQDLFTSFIVLSRLLLYFLAVLSTFSLVVMGILILSQYNRERFFEGVVGDLCACCWGILIQSLFCYSFISITIHYIEFTSFFMISSLRSIESDDGQKCFSYKGAKLWNDLSTKVKTSKTYEVFKKRICNVSSEC